MSAPSIAERVVSAQQKLVEAQTAYEKHLETFDASDEASALANEELGGKVDSAKKTYEALKKAEERLAATAEPPVNGGGTDLTVRDARRPFAAPAQKINPADYVLRALTVAVKQHMDPGKRPAIEILKETYGEDDATRAVFSVITRAATVPADTVTSGWASQLVQTSIGEFFAALMPNSVYPALRARGGSFTFGRNGVISLPTRSSTPTIAGSFVAQGAPIPVRQGAFTAVTFTPKKMGVISTFTRDIAEHSTPAIEGLIRQAIAEDTSVAIDTILLDATAADTTRPAGLRNGVSESANSTLTTIDGLIADLRTIAASLITGTNGNVRDPVWVLNPSTALSIRTKTNTAGEMPFAAEITGNTLFGWPIILSTNIPSTRILALDAADFVTATGDTPRFDVSDQAVLHMEDTSPLAIGTAGTPNTVAAPVRSLWQTDTLGVRMLLDINWGMRRSGVVAWSETFAW